MKRTWWYGGGLLLILAVVVGLAGVSNSAHDAKRLSVEAASDAKASVVEAQSVVAPQSRLSGEEIRAIDLDVARIQPVSLAAAVQDYTGELTEKNVQAQIESTLAEIVRQKVDFSWGAFRPVPIVILYEDPDGKANTRMGIGVAVPPNTVVKEPLRVENFRSMRAVRHIHKGPHDELGQVYRYVGESLRKNAYGSSGRRPTRGGGGGSEGWPVVLQILDDPTRFKADQLRTVINIPVK